jgi:hypothetical protein
MNDSSILPLLALGRIQQYGDRYHTLLTVALDQHKGDLGKAVRIADLVIQRERLHPRSSRFAKGEDCGHDADGDFSTGNTCAAGALHSFPSIPDPTRPNGSYHVEVIPNPAHHESPRDEPKFYARVLTESGDTDHVEGANSLEKAIKKGESLHKYYTKAVREDRKSRFAKVPTASEISAHEVGVILADQYSKVQATEHGILDKKTGERRPYSTSPEKEIKKWVTSSSFHLINLPLWSVRTYADIRNTDHSYSTGPIIVDRIKAYSDDEIYGSFGSYPDAIILDGKHRRADAYEKGITHLEAYIGDDVIEDLLGWIERFESLRVAFSDALESYYANVSKESVQSLYRAGIACGLSREQIKQIFEQRSNGEYFDIELGEFYNEKI